MSQHDFEIANQGFPAFRSDLNSGLQALASNSAGATEPSSTYAYQFWYDETTDLLKLRNSDDDAWITLAAFDQTNDEWEIRSAVIQAVDSAGVVIKTDDGTTRVTIADDGSVTINTSLDVDNIKIDGNSITSTDTNGNINITPNGTGKVVLDGLSYPTADGTDGQVLTTDGAGNIAFEDAGGAGKVLQVVSDTFDTQTTITGTTAADTGISLSITPSSTSSKILILADVSHCGADANYVYLEPVRNSTTLYQSSVSKTFSGSKITFAGQSANNDDNLMFNNNIVFEDSPSTTSSITYKIQGRTSTAGVSFAVNRRLSADDTATISSLTLMEIAG